MSQTRMMDRALHLSVRRPSTTILALGLLFGLSMIAVYAVSKRMHSTEPWVESEIMVPMRDGVRLHTIIWKPAQPGRYPVVLTRGYHPGSATLAGPFVKSGYVFVGQSTRGHGASEGAEGIANRFFDDARDGSDTLTWISREPWSDGNIAMYGKSYWAATQWLVAVEQHPNLKAIIPQVMNADLWQCVYRCNGALTLALTADGRAYDKSDREEIARMGRSYFLHLPLITLDELVGSRQKGARELWKQYVTHSTFDDYWQAISIRGDGQDGKYSKIRIPVYVMGGWYDYYAGAGFTSFQRLRQAGAAEEIRIIMNPSDHLNRVVGDRGFGDQAGKDEIRLAIRWLDYVLKGLDNGLKDEPPITIFVMGVNQWRQEREWPLARTRFTKYFFRNPQGGRIGELSTVPPEQEEPTTFTYDPGDPVPTLGGNHSFTDQRLAQIIRAGAVDQRPNEGRSDVLLFSTPPLTENVEVTGPIVVNLFAASTAPDTDFTAKLIDVYPDGTAYNLTEGIIRARFRKSVWGAPELLVPGRVAEYRLELQPTSNVFLAGHQIRVHVTSSNFPLWDRNPNTGHRQGMDAEMRVARQTIYHDRTRPSHIELPIIPARETHP